MTGQPPKQKTVKVITSFSPLSLEMLDFLPIKGISQTKLNVQLISLTLTNITNTHKYTFAL